MGSDFLFPDAGALTGMGSVVDLLGTRSANTSPDGAVADSLAMKSDWEAVGRDLKDAMSRAEAEREDGD